MVESRSMVSGASPGPRPSRPGPGQQLPAHPIQLADVAPPEAAQEGPQGGRRLDHATMTPARSRRRAARRRRQCSHRRPTPMPPGSASCLQRWLGQGRISQVNVAVDQFTRPRCWARVTGRISPALATSDDHQRQFGCGRGAQVVASFGCSWSGVGFVFQKPLSPKPGALSYPFSTPPLSSLRWIGA